MSRVLALLSLTLLALATLACGITINLPMDEINTGPTQIEEIHVPKPDAEVADLSLNFAAGKMELRPGAQDALVSGTATYNVQDLKPKIKTEGEKIVIETGDLEIEGIPKFGKDVKNDWDFMLSDMPIRLSIDAGAYQGDLELGGLSLKSLEIDDGAADTRLKFTEPNKVEMETLRYVTGASNIKLSNLANANFASMIFRGGAGNYSLDFSGDLRQDAVVTIEAGMSQVEIIVPEGVSARVIFKGSLANVDASQEWQKSGDTYIMPGSGPTLTINVDMGAGNLKLVAR